MFEVVFWYGKTLTLVVPERKTVLSSIGAAPLAAPSPYLASSLLPASPETESKSIA